MLNFNIIIIIIWPLKDIYFQRCVKWLFQFYILYYTLIDIPEALKSFKMTKSLILKTNFIN